jgi:hypothetical protein
LRYEFEFDQRKIRCCPYFLDFTVKAMLYDAGFKRIELNQLLEYHGDRDFEEVDNTTENDDSPEFAADNDENDALFPALAELRSDLDFNNEKDTDFVVSENNKMSNSDTLVKGHAGSGSQTVYIRSVRRKGKITTRSLSYGLGTSE